VPVVFTLVFRVALAFVAGAIIGLERARRGQPAGLRLHVLVCMGAALLMALPVGLPRGGEGDAGFHNGDPGRLAAQVVAGIGFLGSGLIIRMGNTVRGLTTATSLWFVGGIGLALGAGMYTGAALAEALCFFILLYGVKIRDKLFPALQYKIILVNFKTEEPDVMAVLHIIKGEGWTPENSGLSIATKKGKGCASLRLLVSMPDNANLGSLARRIKAVRGVTKVTVS
jgi:putative Mg2+ transporter-C (MgtC) family protein